MVAGRDVLEEVDLATDRLNALLLGLGHLHDVAVHRVLRASEGGAGAIEGGGTYEYNRNLGSHGDGGWGSLDGWMDG